MLTEKELYRFKKELQPSMDIMEKAIHSIQDQEISKYPVFVVFKEKEEVGIGLPLVVKDDSNDSWSINASTLEELATKKVVLMENIKRFTDIYKTHQNTACCLVWTEGSGQFVFLPLPTK